VAREVSEFSFDAVIAVQGLEDGILDMIDQRRRGSFQGEQEGRDCLRALIKGARLLKRRGRRRVPREMGDHLTRDMRVDGHPAVSIEDQLMRSATVEGLYDFLFGLDYLKPRSSSFGAISRWTNCPQASEGHCC
jgi:hypothetical protein